MDVEEYGPTLDALLNAITDKGVLEVDLSQGWLNEACAQHLANSFKNGKMHLLTILDLSNSFIS